MRKLAVRCGAKGRTIFFQFVSSHVVITTVQVVRIKCDSVESVATLPLRDEQTAVVMSSFRWWTTLKGVLGSIRLGGNIVDKSPIRVLVVEDCEPWRRYFSTALQKQPELQVFGEVSDGLEAVHQAEELQPDLILLDIGLPTLNGIEAARRIRKVSLASRILFVSENRSADIAEEALSTGASGYVVKSDAESELLPAVKAVLEGKRFISASLASHFLVATTLSTTQTTLS